MRFLHICISRYGSELARGSVNGWVGMCWHETLVPAFAARGTDRVAWHQHGYDDGGQLLEIHNPQV